MRTLVKITVPVEAGNETIQNGTLPRVFAMTIEQLKPESSYFYTENGRRTALLVFDLKQPSDIPAIAEPLFMGLNAQVEFHPVMNLEDLRAGLARVSKSH